MSKPLRILSLDGGGIKGLLGAILLDEMETRTGKRIYELFDMIIGTSTGGIMALLLTCPTAEYTAKNVIEFYTKENAQRIFKPKFWKLHWKFDSNNIEGVLKEKFSNPGTAQTEIQFGQVLKPVIVTAYDTVSRDSKFFRSTDVRHKNYFMWEMARATSAAPTFFEPFKLDGMCLVDGGLFSNNPTMFGVIEAMKEFPDRDLTVVSIGTGSSVSPIPYDTMKSWTPLHWGVNLFGMVSDAQSDTTGYVMPRIDKCKNYFRFNVCLTEREDNMDDVSVDELTNLTNIAKTAIRGQWAGDLDKLIKELATYE